jgi:transcriptional regulator GlxA family with amidase domain
MVSIQGRPHASGKPWTPRDPAAPLRFGFVLVPNFTLIGLGSAVDPLRIANMVAERRLYEFVTLSELGAPVEASDGVRVTPNFSLANAPVLDAALVIGPNPIPKTGVSTIVQWLKQRAADGVALGGVDTGSYFLARAHLLDGYRCTIHWEDMAELTDHFPHVIVSPKLFEIDRDRCSCSGGIAAVDMMIHLIKLGPGGRQLASAVSDLLICEHRGPDEQQKVPLRSLLGSCSPKLTEAVTLMENNVEEPLSMEELATHIGVSSRQLERLFGESLQCTPSHYYLQIRLERAHQLLKKTNHSISDVAAACGFASIAHFTTRYGKAFGLPPRLARLRFSAGNLEKK